MVVGLVARDLQPEVIQHPPVDPVGGPRDLPARPAQTLSALH